MDAPRGPARPLRLGVLGDPLAFTLSPVLHRAGLEALGLAGESEALRTAPGALATRLGELSARGFRGVNLTHPLKEAALPLLARVSAPARRARSVNTVSFEPGGPAGDTTDGAGFLDFLAALGRRPGEERVLLLGAGGAARSLALALAGAGARVTASARDPQRATGALADAAAGVVAWRSEAEAAELARATLVVNTTPLAGPEGALAPEALPPRALAVDLVYGPAVTPWVARARATGREAWDGLGLLVHQARRSLAIWTGREAPLAALERAVGWPR